MSGDPRNGETLSQVMRLKARLSILDNARQRIARRRTLSNHALSGCGQRKGCGLVQLPGLSKPKRPANVQSVLVLDHGIPQPESIFHFRGPTLLPPSLNLVCPSAKHGGAGQTWPRRWPGISQRPARQTARGERKRTLLNCLSPPTCGRPLSFAYCQVLGSV
jgi:hypothetical protein